MGRAGGWILGLVVVIGMAAAGFVGLRPVLFRKTVTIHFNSSVQWNPQEVKAVSQAFEEKGFRAGSFRVTPAFVSQWKQQGNQLLIMRSGPQWSVIGPDDPPLEPNVLYLYPHDRIVGNQAARWARRSGMQRVFLLSFGEFEAGFKEEATAAGIECRSDLLKSQGHSLVDGVLATNPELIILGRPVRPIVDALRKSGYSGKVLAYDDDFDPGHYSGRQPAELEGLFCAASFTPAPVALTEFWGHRMASLVLDAIDRANTDDHTAIYRSLAASAEFTADGSSTFPGALYVVRKGILEFVEPLK
jgi:hypothetical protein